MSEMIENRKGSAVLEERRDLLSNLIRASMEKNDPQRKDTEFEFTHRDLLGNIFLFLLAGKLFRFPVLQILLSIKLCSRLQDHGECFIVRRRSSGDPSRGAGGTL